jgi:hypothetical protein
MLAEFFRGRSLTLYRCIGDVQDLKTRIEVCQPVFAIFKCSQFKKDLERETAAQP